MMRFVWMFIVSLLVSGAAGESVDGADAKPTRIDPATAAYLGILPEELNLSLLNLTIPTIPGVPILYRAWASDTKIDAVTATGGDCYIWLLVYDANNLKYWGDCEGLEPYLNATTCNATATGDAGSCSIGIYTGDYCYNSRVQGVPLFTTGTNPYNNVKYRTNNRGYSYPWSGFNGTITNIGVADFDGRPFIIKNLAGTIVACGVLQKYVL